MMSIILGISHLVPNTTSVILSNLTSNTLYLITSKVLSTTLMNSLNETTDTTSKSFILGHGLLLPSTSLPEFTTSTNTQTGR